MGCNQSNYAPEVNLNFSNPSSPTDSKEEKIHVELETFFQERKTLLTTIAVYKGCRDIVRQAMNNPTVESERQAFESLLVAVNAIETFRACSRFIERMSHTLFLHLLSSQLGEDKKSPPLEAHTFLTNQTLTMDLAEIFNFVCQFDQFRLVTPDIPNDFAFYRRLLPKFQKHPNIIVKEDLVADMAMFIADHSPMINSILKSLKVLVEQNNYQYRTTFRDLIGTLANSCLRSLTNRSTTSALESKVFIARTMVISIVVYDQIENHVFARDSPIKTRECIMALQSQFNENDSGPLLRMIRYSTLSYQTAPEPTQALLDDV